jgi:hypothetical protein
MPGTLDIEREPTITGEELTTVSGVAAVMSDSSPSK